MKKVILIVIGSLAGLYTVAAVIQFVLILMKTNLGSSYGVKNLVAAGVVVCLGLAVCLWCLTRAFRKQDKEDEEDDAGAADNEQ